MKAEPPLNEGKEGSTYPGELVAAHDLEGLGVKGHLTLHVDVLDGEVLSGSRALMGDAMAADERALGDAAVGGLGLGDVDGVVIQVEVDVHPGGMHNSREGRWQ